MYNKSVSLRTMIATTAVAITGMIVIPQAASAQGPSGSYRNSCRSATMIQGGYLQAECRTTNGRWQQSRIRIADCQGREIANNNGRLICADGRRGNSKKDRDRFDGDRRDGRHDRDGRGRPDDRDRRDDRYDRDNRGGRDTRPGGYDGRGRDDRDNRSGVVIFYNTRFGGRSMAIRNDYPNLEKTGFNDVVSSLRIAGSGVWQICSDQMYMGRCTTVSSDVRDLASISMQDRISSLRRIR